MLNSLPQQLLQVKSAEFRQLNNILYLRSMT
jgi:hypothetical protein